MRFNKALLSQNDLYATGTTGKLVAEELGVPINKLQSDPPGGDQHIGAKIATPGYEGYRPRLDTEQREPGPDTSVPQT